MRSALLVTPLLSLALSFPVHAHAVSQEGEAGPTEARAAGLSLRVTAPSSAAKRGLPVEFTLLDASHARIELVDRAGRVVRAQHVGGLGPGRHSLDLSNGRPLAPGIYLLRLGQSGQQVETRTAVLF